MENEIAKKIKSVRHLLGKSQEEFALMIRCCRVSLSKYETGYTQPSAEKYARVLELERQHISADSADKAA